VVEKDPQTVIIIQQADPQVVYVPSYNPTVVYGVWAYPAYPPYYVYPAHTRGSVFHRGRRRRRVGVRLGALQLARGRRERQRQSEHEHQREHRPGEIRATATGAGRPIRFGEMAA